MFTLTQYKAEKQTQELQTKVTELSETELKQVGGARWVTGEYDSGNACDFGEVWID